MEVKNGLIEQAKDVVDGIASHKIKNHLVRLEVMKARKALTGALEEYTEVKNDLIKEYGEEVDGGWQIAPDNPRINEFADAMTDLMNAETALVMPTLGDVTMSIFDLSVDELEVLIAVGAVKYEDETPIALVEDSEDGDDKATG